MSDYIHFDVKDFVLDESFCAWVIKDLEADSMFWEKFVRDHPLKAETIRLARELVEEVHKAHDDLTDEELRMELGRLSQARLEREAGSVFSKPSMDWKRIGGVAAAIGFIGLMGILFYSIRGNRSETADRSSAYHLRTGLKSNSLKEIVNNQAEPQWTELPDGSRIQLHRGSRISFSESMSGSQRDVYLSGEAFFEVKKDPGRPFVVYANELVTKVLGTSFTIQAFEGQKEVKVAVRTGKVSVFVVKDKDQAVERMADGKAELVLTPNQEVVFNRNEQRMKRSLIATPQPVNAENLSDQLLEFDNTPVNKVFGELERIYEVSIVYDAELLSGCALTAQLANEPMYEKLDLICKAIEARYEVIDGQIVIYGKKCQ